LEGFGSSILSGNGAEDDMKRKVHGDVFDLNRGQDRLRLVLLLSNKNVVFTDAGVSYGSKAWITLDYEITLEKEEIA